MCDRAVFRWRATLNSELARPRHRVQRVVMQSVQSSKRLSRSCISLPVNSLYAFARRSRVISESVSSYRQTSTSASNSGPSISRWRIPRSVDCSEPITNMSIDRSVVYEAYACVPIGNATKMKNAIAASDGLKRSPAASRAFWAQYQNVAAVKKGEKPRIPMMAKSPITLIGSKTPPSTTANAQPPNRNPQKSEGNRRAGSHAASVSIEIAMNPLPDTLYEPSIGCPKVVRNTIGSRTRQMSGRTMPRATAAIGLPNRVAARPVGFDGGDESTASDDT